MSYTVTVEVFFIVRLKQLYYFIFIVVYLDTQTPKMPKKPVLMYFLHLTYFVTTVDDQNTKFRKPLFYSLPSTPIVLLIKTVKL